MNMRTLAAVGLVGLALSAGTAWGQVEAEAKAKLQGMAEAIKKARTLQYDVVQRGEGGILSGFSPIIRGKVLMERGEGGWKMRREGKVEMFGQNPTSYVVVSVGERTTWIDERDKQVKERASGQAGGEAVDYAKQAHVAELSAGEPLSRELAAPVIKLEKAQDVEGVMCDVVYVDYGENNQSPSRWFIAPQDRLPRKVQSLFKNLSPEDATAWYVLNLKIDEAVPEGSFAISTPPGYTFSGADAVAPKPAAATPEASPASGSGQGATPAAPRERAIGGNVGDLAPDFELSQPDGSKIKLSSLRGQSVAVVDFWGTWCLPCRKAAPELNKIHTNYKDKGVRVLALSVREKDDEAPARYLRESGYEYTLLLKGDEAAKDYRVKVYPTYFVVDKSGVITARIESIDDLYAKLSAELDKALGAAGGETPRPMGGDASR